METKQKILTYLRRNRVSSTEVADCLGKTGVLEGVVPVCQGMYVAGSIKYVYAHSESNWSIHEQIRDTHPDEVVLMDGINVAGRAIVGELVVKFLHLYCQASAIVTLGKMRDANDLIKNRYPVWCRGFNPVGCFNMNVEETDEVRRMVEQGRDKYNGAIAVCDDTGVVVIPRSEITDEFYEKLVFIEQQEDIWFDCIDFRKWDTYDTVCLKRYEKRR